MTVFSFYWFGKRKFGKFSSGFPVIGGPARPPPHHYSSLGEEVCWGRGWGGQMDLNKWNQGEVCGGGEVGVVKGV